MFDELRNLDVLTDDLFLDPVDFGHVEKTIYDPANGIDLISNYDSDFFKKEIVDKSQMSPIVTYKYSSFNDHTRDLQLDIYDVPVSEIARPSSKEIEGFFEMNSGSNDEVVIFGVTILSFMQLCYHEHLQHLLPYPSTTHLRLPRHEGKAELLAGWLETHVHQGISDNDYFEQLFDKIALVEEGNATSWFKYQESLFGMLINRAKTLGANPTQLKRHYYETRLIKEDLFVALNNMPETQHPIANPVSKDRAIANGFDIIILGLTQSGEYVDELIT